MSSFQHFLDLPSTHTGDFPPYSLRYFHTVFPRVGHGVGQKDKRREGVPHAKPKINLKICAA